MNAWAERCDRSPVRLLANDLLRAKWGRGELVRLIDYRLVYDGLIGAAGHPRPPLKLASKAANPGWATRGAP